MTLYLKQPLNAQQPITTVEELHKHLYSAAKVEMITIPLYLYAAYSIKTAGDWQWDPGMSAFRTIRSVVIEEMLHLCLARNLLVATGAPPAPFYDEDFVPVYPRPMPQREPELMLHLEPCSQGLMTRVFMPFELPAKTHAPPQPDHYNTIGQFYAAIVDGLERLSGPDLWKNSRVECQYTTTYWNQDGGGKPIGVTDLPSALKAIDTIVEQGEGANPDDPMVPLHPADPKAGFEEYSHYAKFSRIAEGIDLIRDVWHVPTDPDPAKYDEAGQRLSDLFDAAYCYVLCMIDAIYESPTPQRIVAGSTSPRYGLERTFIAAMGGLLYPIAELLVRHELPDGSHAAPAFRFFAFDEAVPRKDQLVALCEAAIPHFPTLGGDDGVRQLIDKLPSVPVKEPA